MGRQPATEQVIPEVLDKIRLLVEGIAPELLLELIADEYEKRIPNNGSKYNTIACAWLNATVYRLRQELPGDPTPKDLKCGFTIGERCASILRAAEIIDKRRTLMGSYGLQNPEVANIIDLVVADCSAERMIEDWEKARKEREAVEKECEDQPCENCGKKVEDGCPWVESLRQYPLGVYICLECQTKLEAGDDSN